MIRTFAILTVLTLGGCSILPDWNTEPETTINTVAQYAQCTELSVVPHPAKMSFEGFEWEVWNKELVLENGNEMNSADAVWVLHGTDYEALSRNMAEITRYIQSLTEIIRNYETQAERIVEHNKSKLTGNEENSEGKQEQN